MTKVLSVQHLEEAVQALQHVARYDSMRLETYRQRENLADRIWVSPISASLALRFDDVGYFNRVYCAEQSVWEELPEIEAFYHGSPFGCELVCAPDDPVVNVTRISRPGWAIADRYAWMFTDDSKSLAPVQSTTFAVRPPESSQREQFLIAYLRAFEAPEDRFPAAVRNMRHLFDRPELDFSMAWHGKTLAGVAMMMYCNGSALLCAGAALPEFRDMGCHAALLAARIRQASESGCQAIYSWAALGGQSQSNMERAGLSVVGATTSWRFSPESLV